MLKWDKNKGHFTVMTCVYFWSHLAQFFLEWEMFHTVVREIKTHILCSIYIFFPPESRVVYEKLWKNFVEPGRPQMTIWRMRIACWIPEVTNTHSQYVILIAFPLQQWLQKRASILRHTCSTLPVLLELLPFVSARWVIHYPRRPIWISVDIREPVCVSWSV